MTTFFIRPGERDTTPPKFLQFWDMKEIQYYNHKMEMKKKLHKIAASHDIPEITETHDFETILKEIKQHVETPSLKK